MKYYRLIIIPKSSLIYIDSNLAGGLKGEDIAVKLHELGFPNLYIVSWHEPERFSHLTFLKGVQRKNPPF